MKAKVAEVFKSIQGEGLYQGFEQVFIRFFGCNMKCRFCDTKLNDYHEETVLDLLKKINSYQGYHSVVLTGGEPLIPINFLKKFCQLLKEEDKIIYLETNGTLYQNLKEIINWIDIIAMDFKLPSSTELSSFWEEHTEFLKIAKNVNIFIKVIISPATKVEDIYKTVEIIKNTKRALSLVLQPENPFEIKVEGKINNFKQSCEKEGINVKVIPQLHKSWGLK